jgi:tyrosine-specific transport protein
MNTNRNIIGGALLVAGTSIGGGMLALPVLTSLGGFLPSLVIYLLCWLFMACTGLLLLEVACWLPKDSNIVSMAEHTLGSVGKYAAWGLYLFLFYCLTLAYIVGCGDLVAQLFSNSIPEWMGMIIFVIVASPFLFLGAKVIGHLNVYLMIGLGISYFTFVFLGYRYVNTELLSHANWSASLIALPIAFTAFAYQGIVPTLFNYMHQDVRATRLAILFGSFIPLIAYVIWQWLILGIVPTEGPHGLGEALAKGQNAVYPLKHFIGSTGVYAVGQFFAFFALVTSFFGVTLGLLDFLADGLKVKKDLAGKFALIAAIIIPPLLFAFIQPHLFLVALDYAGGYGCAILLGLLPILMVWQGRYRQGLKCDYQLPGGKVVLSLLILFVFFELYCQLFIG